MIARLALAATASLAALGLAGCSSAPSPPLGEDFSGAISWTVTQTITNASTVDLTVQDVSVDSGGTVTPGYPTTIRAGTPSVFLASQTGGQLDLALLVTLATPSGQTLSVESDVLRKGPGNVSTAQLSGQPGGVAAGPITIGPGNTPTADFTLEPCTPGTTCSRRSSTDPGSPNN